MSKILKGKIPFNTYLRKSFVNSFFINLVQESEIEELINDLNQNTSLGPCSIPVKIIKNHVDILKQLLPYLIKARKTARVTAIFKKEDPQLPSNYCSISALSVFSRWYEKCIYPHLYAF